MKRHRARFVGRLWLIAGLAGVAALLGGTMVTPQMLTALSPDKSVSAPLLAKFLMLRNLALLCGALTVAVASWKRWGSGWGVPAALVSAVWLGVMMHQLYPHNLLEQPAKLLRAVLGQEILLSDFDPQTQMAVAQHDILRAKYPVINIHAHFRRWYQHWTPQDLQALMKACNVIRIIDLDGELGPRLKQEVEQYAKPYPQDFTVFATFWFPDGVINWPYFTQSLQQLEQAKQLGAQGIKIWKNLGLKTLDTNGCLIAVDDVRLDLVWEAAARLKLPILIHVGDPSAFFKPIDQHNERYEELHANPDWSFYGPQFPPLATVLNQFERVLARHPQTTFILAHLGNRTDDLSAAAGMLDRHPNLHMDISARISELGRQPVTARTFFIKYQDRLLFGTDGNPEASVYRAYFRFLETRDEYFDYPFWPEFNYGRWKISGIGLPDEVLRKLYHDNAAKLLGLPLLPNAREER